MSGFTKSSVPVVLNEGWSLRTEVPMKGSNTRTLGTAFSNRCHNDTITINLIYYRAGGPKVLEVLRIFMPSVDHVMHIAH